jgi:aromatase
MSHTDNAVVINAELDDVWELTNDLTRWTELFTEYAAVDILEQRGACFRFRLTMHPDENGNAWSWISERTLDVERHTVTAHRIETGWFEYMHIAWTYEAVAGGTRMRWSQDFSMRPDSPVDDAAMTDRINRNSALQQAHIKDEVERLATTNRHYGRHAAPAALMGPEQ